MTIRSEIRQIARKALYLQTRVDGGLLVLGAITALAAAAGQVRGQDFDQVQIETIPLTDRVHMLTGAGGNLGLCVGENGAFLIDDQFAPLSEKIRAAVASVTDQPLRFVVNTHWHGDHVGGNENFANGGSIIVAHENVRKRMESGQFFELFDREVPPASPAALPIITFETSIRLHLAGEAEVLHLPAAHTDGDAIIRFLDENVVHAGDVFFNGSYPIIDVGSGGSADGLIAAVELILDLVDENTKIIPGHGPLADRTALQAYHDMLVAAIPPVKKMVVMGMSLEDLQASKPSKMFDATWGAGFVTPDMWLKMLYMDFSRGVGGQQAK